MPPSTSTSPFPTSHLAAHYAPPYPTSTTLSQLAPIPPLPTSGTYTLLRVHSSSLNPVEYKIGSLPWPFSRLALGAAPITPGVDFVGRVWKTNDSRFKGGDVVWGMLSGPQKYGSCAQFVVAKGTGGISKVPEGFLGMCGDGKRSLDELGAFGVAGHTALQTLDMSDLPFNRSGGQEKGGKVFINGGSGGVGSFTVQLAKHCFGCEKVVTTCSGANADFVRSLGADEVVDYRSQNVVEALKEWTAKHGPFDAVIDNVGDANLYLSCHHFLKPGKEGGKFTQIGGGFSMTDIIGIAKVNLWPSILGGGKRPWKFYLLSGAKEGDWERVGRWMVEGRLTAVIEDGNRFELADVGKAFEKLKGGRTRGKIVIGVADDE